MFARACFIAWFSAATMVAYGQQPVDEVRAQQAGLGAGQGALVSELVTPGPGSKAGIIRVWV